MEQPCRKRHRSARLSDDARIPCDTSHCCPDFSLSHRNNVVNEFLDMLEVQSAHRLCTQAVGECARYALSRKSNDLSFAEALLCVVRQFRFHADNLCRGTAQLDGTSHSAD